MRVVLASVSVSSIMPGRSAEITGAWPGRTVNSPFHAGHDDLRGVLRHQHALGRNQLELEGV